MPLNIFSFYVINHFSQMKKTPANIATKFCKILLQFKKKYFSNILTKVKKTTIITESFSDTENNIVALSIIKTYQVLNQ